MKDLNPSGKKGKSPKKKELVEESNDFKPLTKIENIETGTDTELEDGGSAIPPNLEDLAKTSLEDFADAIQGPEMGIVEGLPQDTDYLKEGSPEQEEALKEAVEYDKQLIVSHDYGSSEWKLITSAINEKLDYRSLTHAMPLGTKGAKGVLIKTMVMMSGSCAVTTVIDRNLRIAQDPEAVNLFILR